MHERIKPVSFPEEEITYLTPSWDDMNKLAFDISRAMLEDGRQFDRVVTLARGGWPMAVPVVDFL
jgi:hypoxanthine phosphoribosyltransferase